MYIFIITIIVIIIIYLLSKWNESENHFKAIQAFQIEYSQLARIIDESMKIINQTKNIETGISRFNVIKEDMKRAFEIAPPAMKPPLSFSIKLSNDQDYYISSINELNQIDEAKVVWIRSYYKEKIITEFNKSNTLSDAKLKSIQLKKALNIALKAMDYIPEDAYIKESISDIEKKLLSLKNVEIESKTIPN